MKTPAYGATPADWNTLDLGLGLTEDLLPVVSNPTATISPNSKMKGIGKTPSIYNRDRKVVGLPDWTQKKSTAAEVGRWAKEPDYGICLQTRAVRALDIDVDDREKAMAIARFIGAKLMVWMPKRLRSNSGKCLMAFRLEGNFPKRILKVDGGIIEFLGNGQQFIAYGTHPSGERYEWEWNYDEDFPTLTTEQFETLWAAIVERFGVEDAVVLSGVARKRGEDLGLDDEVVEKLDVVGEGRDGQLAIVCPFVAEHSSDTGELQTVYFPAGTGGYVKGHFHCLHASCQKRSDQDFLDKLGIQLYCDDFEAVGKKVAKPPKDGAEGTEGGEGADFDEKGVDLPEPAPSLTRDKNGRPENTVLNVTAMLARPDLMGLEVRYDEFRDEIMFAPIKDPKGWRRFGDTDYTKLRRVFDRMSFKPVGRDLIRDCVDEVARAKSFDSAIAWLNGLVWDGVPRVKGFAERYLSAEKGEYADSVGMFLWTALAGRCLVPGIHMRMAPILVGEQNIGKSTVIKAMVPDAEHFAEVSFEEKEDNLARRLRGRLVAEISELRGMTSRELEAIKGFIARSHEDWVPKFKEFSNIYPRRLVFIGTSNKDEFLADETGNTRWLPLRVGTCDVDGVKRDREQLWAEGAVLFKEHGIMWQEALRLAVAEHEEFEVSDEWADVVSDWLAQTDMDGQPNSARPYFMLVDIAREALSIDPKNLDRRDALRLGKSLRKLGYEKRSLRANGVVTKVWSEKIC